MNKTLLIAIGLACALVVAWGVMHQNRKLPILVLDLVEGGGELHQIVYLPGDYGFLMNYQDNPAKPKLFLYNRPAWTITTTNDFKQFIAGLKQFPDGAKIDEVEQCQVSFSREMPAAQEKLLNQTIKAKGFKMREEEEGCPFRICTCIQAPRFLKDPDQIDGSPLYQTVKRILNAEPPATARDISAFEKLNAKMDIRQVFKAVGAPDIDVGSSRNRFYYWLSDYSVVEIDTVLTTFDTGFSVTHHKSGKSRILINKLK